MSTNSIPLNPKIKVIFQGFLVARIRHGEVEAKVGAHKTSVCHQPRIHIKEIASSGAENPIILDANDSKPDDNFSISVENSSVSGIRVFQKDEESFNRLDDENDRNDFRWFLDIDELHGKTLSRDESMLFPVFTLNNGLFYTHTRSPGEVRIKRGASAVSKRFGQFGLEIAANIYFDQPDTRAIFKKADKTLLTVEAANPSTFVILIDCNCHQDENISDFPLVYDVVQGVSEPERFDFEGDPRRTGFNRSPEVYCGGIR